MAELQELSELDYVMIIVATIIGCIISEIVNEFELLGSRYHE